MGELSPCRHLNAHTLPSITEGGVLGVLGVHYWLLLPLCSTSPNTPDTFPADSLTSISPFSPINQVNWDLGRSINIYIFDAWLNISVYDDDDTRVMLERIIIVSQLTFLPGPPRQKTACPWRGILVKPFLTAWLQFFILFVPMSKFVPNFCFHLMRAMTCSRMVALILRLRLSSSGMIFQPTRPLRDFFIRNVTSFPVRSNMAASWNTRINIRFLDRRQSPFKTEHWGALKDMITKNIGQVPNCWPLSRTWEQTRVFYLKATSDFHLIPIFLLLSAPSFKFAPLFYLAFKNEEIIGFFLATMFLLQTGEIERDQT